MLKLLQCAKHNHLKTVDHLKTVTQCKKVMLLLC